MAAVATSVAVAIWVLIALFILYIFLYQRTGPGIQDREFIAERLGAQTQAMRNARAAGLSAAFPRTLLEERLIQTYKSKNPVEIANVLEGPAWLERVANNEDPESRFLPRNAPEIIREWLDENYEADTLQESLASALSQIKALSLSDLYALRAQNLSNS